QVHRKWRRTSPPGGRVRLSRYRRRREVDARRVGLEVVALALGRLIDSEGGVAGQARKLVLLEQRRLEASLMAEKVVARDLAAAAVDGDKQLAAGHQSSPEFRQD